MLTYELVLDSQLVPIETKRTRRVVQTAGPPSMENIMLSEDASSNNNSEDLLQYFMIKPNDGVLVLKQPLDYEKSHEFRFSVVVKDSGVPVLSSTARVIVQGRFIGEIS